MQNVNETIQASKSLTVKAWTASGPGLHTSAVGFSSGVHVLVAEAASAGTTPTLDVKLQKSAAAARNFDDSDVTLGEAWVELRKGTNDNIELGIQFTATGDVSVSSVKLYLKRAGTIAAGKVIACRIEGDSTNAPDGTSLGSSANVDATAIGTTGEWVEFTWPIAPDLSDGGTYWIVLSGDYTVSASNHILLGVDTVGSGGNVAVYDSAWAAITSTQTGNAQVFAYTFTDISGGTHTQVTTTALTEEEAIDFASIGGVEVIRPYVTVGGTGGPSFQAAGVFILGGKATQ